MNEIEPLDPARILEVGLAFWSSKTLLSAVELGVFTELEKGPLSGEVLTQRMGIHVRGARDFFDALVALCMLQRDGDTYTNASDVDAFLDKAKPSYAGGFLEMANNRLYPFWGNLTEALRTGQPQSEVKTGKDFFGVLPGDLSDDQLGVAPPIVHERQRQRIDLATGEIYHAIALQPAGLQRKRVGRDVSFAVA